MRYRPPTRLQQGNISLGYAKSLSRFGLVPGGCAHGRNSNGPAELLRVIFQQTEGDLPQSPRGNPPEFDPFVTDRSAADTGECESNLFGIDKADRQSRNVWRAR